MMNKPTRARRPTKVKYVYFRGGKAFQIMYLTIIMYLQGLVREVFSLIEKKKLMMNTKDLNNHAETPFSDG